MTKWYIALPFVLLALAGFVGVALALGGELVGLLFGVPCLGAAMWFFSTKYVGTNG